MAVESYALTISNLVAAAATYESGQDFTPLRKLADMVGQTSPEVRKPLEAGLIRLLGPSTTFEAERFACKQLGIIGSQKALPALARLLKDDETAGIACLALTTYPPGGADKILRAELRRARGSARIQIIDILGERRDSKSVTLLAKAARDTGPAVANAAIRALGKVGNLAAWKAIGSAAKHSDPTLSRTIAEAKIRCAERLAAGHDRIVAISYYEDALAPGEPAFVRRNAFGELVRLDADHGEQVIISVLQTEDALLRPMAIAAVRTLPNPDASRKFAAILPTLKPEEQVWMIDSLAARGGEAARSAIEKSFASADPNVRRAAIAALSRIGDESSVSLYCQTLASSKNAEDARAIEAALVALGGASETDRAILAELKKSSGQVGVHLMAALVGRMGTGAVPVLLEESNQSDPAVAKAAFCALGNTASGSDLPALLEVMARLQDADVRAEAVSTASKLLGKVDDTSRRSAVVLTALAATSTVESRVSFIGLLPSCGDAKSLAAVEAAAADSDTHVREAAIRAMAEWPNDAAWETLAGVLHQPEAGPLRAVIFGGLVRMAGEENTHPDAKLAEHYRFLISEAQDDADLKQVLGALGGAATPDAVQLAVPLLAKPGVRAEAEVAVKKIAGAIQAEHPQVAEQALEQIKATQ